MDKSIFKGLFNRKKLISTDHIGVYVGKDKLWAYSPATKDRPDIIKDFPVNPSSWNDCFSRLTKEFKAVNVQLTLCSHWYQLLQVEKPQVEKDEMYQSILWAIKNMINVPLYTVHIDYFEFPLAHLDRIVVAVVDRELIKNVIAGAIHSHLNILGISIEEIVISNSAQDDEKAKLVVSHYPGEDVLFTVVKDGKSCMYRRVRGFSELDLVSEQDLSHGMADNLSLELQRSMDYFESQQRQLPVASIDIATDGASETLAELLSANFNQKIKAIEQTNVGSMMAKLSYDEASRES